VLPVLSVCCSLAQDNADVKAFEELQRQLWSARTPAKAQKLMDITAELDSISPIFHQKKSARKII